MCFSNKASFVWIGGLFDRSPSPQKYSLHRRWLGVPLTRSRTFCTLAIRILLPLVLRYLGTAKVIFLKETISLYKAELNSSSFIELKHPGKSIYTYRKTCVKQRSSFKIIMYFNTISSLSIFLHGLHHTM